jgi:molecular chaperone GrpE
MSNTDGALWPDEPVPAGVQPGPRAEPDDAGVVPQAELDEVNDRLRRAVAELDNTRKRYARMAEEQRAKAQADTAAAFLPVIDNLERAVASAPEACEAGAFVAGLQALRNQALSVVESLGFRRHAEVKVPFDPYLHEAVGVDSEADAEPGTVVEVVRPGYGEGDRQLRPAAVLVAGKRD